MPRGIRNPRSDEVDFEQEVTQTEETEIEQSIDTNVTEAENIQSNEVEGDNSSDIGQVPIQNDEESSILMVDNSDLSENNSETEIQQSQEPDQVSDNLLDSELLQQSQSIDNQNDNVTSVYNSVDNEVLQQSQSPEIDVNSTDPNLGTTDSISTQSGEASTDTSQTTDDSSDNSDDDVEPQQRRTVEYEQGCELRFRLKSARVFKSSVAKEYVRIPGPLYVFHELIQHNRIRVSNHVGGEYIGWIELVDISDVLHNIAS